MAEGVVVVIGGLQGVLAGKRYYVAGGSYDPQGDMVLPRHRPRGGDVEGDDSGYQLPPHHLHFLL